MAERPNILLVIVHDLGTRLGAYGEDSGCTPALDRFASQGVRFTKHFATAPFCSPSRAAIFTGKYPHVNGLMGLVNLGWDLPEGNVTLARMLDEAGYETFLFGLQHEVKDRARLGFLHASAAPGGHRCDQVTPQVTEFLRDSAAEGRPFYARVGFGEVHRAYDRYEADDPARVEVPPYMKDTPGAREDLAQFGGAIRTMDAAVGRILDALSAAGLEESTLVVFTTDHGIAFPRAKATLYDPGLNTALIMRWPGVIRSGEVCGELLSNVDLLPTLLEATGTPLPGDIQGRSFWGALRGSSFEPREAIFAEKNTQPNDCKRCVRTERYKYIRNYNEGPMLSLPIDIEKSLTRRDMGDDHLAPRPPVELYDLENDPPERVNLAGGAEYSEVEKGLAETLDRIMRETNDPLLEGGPSHLAITRPPDEAEIIRRLRDREGLPVFSPGRTTTAFNKDKQDGQDGCHS